MTTKIIVKTVKAKDLTLAQANTLHRLRAGIGYRLRTDGKKGSELRMVNNYTATFVSAPSIPVLYRLGLVDFTNGKPDEAGKFASIMLTLGGCDILEEFDKCVGGK